MEVLKDISQLTKGCGVTFIKNDDFHFYEYLMVHPNRETYYLFIDNWTQNHYWDYGAYNLCPEYLFSSIDKAEEAILNVDKSKKITILYE